MQPCSVAKFVSAVTNTSLEVCYEAVGLKVCPECGVAGEKPEFYPFCSRTCRFEQKKRDNIAILTCEWCSKSFPRTVTQIRNAVIHHNKLKPTKGLGHIFCSNKCQGSWLGHNHTPYRGIRASIQTRNDKIWQCYMETGFAAPGVKETLGLDESISTINQVLYMERKKRGGKFKRGIAIKIMTIACKTCSQPFGTYNKKRKYCCTKCYSRANYLRRKEKA